MSKTSKTFLFLVLAFLFPSVVFAAPSVSSVSGTITHGQTITVSGSAFGTKSPAAPLIWDDGEGAVVNETTAVSGVGTGAVRNDGNLGWDEVLPITDKTYFQLQYRAGTMEEVGQAHIRSTKYLAGAHWTGSSTLNGGTNVLVTVDTGLGNYSNDWYAFWRERVSPRWPSEATDQGWLTATNFKDWYCQSGGRAWTGSAIYRYAAQSPFDGTADMTMMPTHYDVGCGITSRIPQPNPRNDWIMNEHTLRRDPGFYYWVVYGESRRVLAHAGDCQGGSLWGWPIRSWSVGAFAKASDNNEQPDAFASRNLLDSNYYHWTLSGQGTNEYYVTLNPTYDPTEDPDLIFYPSGGITYTDSGHTGALRCNINGNWATEGTIGSLSAGTWGYGDNDALGYGTIYVRLADGSDPDTKNKSYIFIGGQTQHQGVQNPGRGDPSMWRFFDDIYIDTTFSRAMLCDNQTYENATVCEPQIPSGWSGGSVTAAVNLGKLPGSGPAYLFVFDSNNDHNATGYPVTISGGGDATAPASPTGLTVL